MKLSLKEVRAEVPNVQTFILEAPEAISWEPGQYMHYVFPHQNEDNRGEERYFTISSAPFENHLSITTRFTDEKGSSFKGALHNLKPEDTIESDGPRGSFLLDDKATKHVLIAGGIGITPYRAMLLQLDHDGKDINADLLYANRDDKPVFGDELEQLASKHQGFHIKPYIGDKRISEDELKKYAEDSGIVFYISGPRPMVEAYQKTLTDIKVPEERIKTDYFPGYELG